MRAQDELQKIQGTRSIWYCGAWAGYGFHEDGFTSGIRAAVEGLGGEVPWERVDAKFVRGWKPVLGWKDYGVRAFVMVGWLVELTKPERIRVVAPEAWKDDSGKFKEL